MDIIHIGAELAPVAKVGGLADVLHGLSRAFLQKKHTVTVILPKYNTLQLNLVDHLEVLAPTQLVKIQNHEYVNTLWRGVVDSIPVVLIESHDPCGFFDRKMIYGCPDDCSRFAYFCISALEYIKTLKPNIVHAHDWHTALIPVLIKENFPEISARTIFSIHNLAYQGICSQMELEHFGFKFPKLKSEGCYNLLKGGIIYADHITTVSPNYAREILSEEIGGSLQPVLKKYQKKITGVLNGIDYDYWNPEKDPLLPFHYSFCSLENKKKVKTALKKRVSLADENTLLVGAITRLVPQKGPELIKAALLRTLENGGQFILLGSALDDETYARFYNLKRKLAGSQHVHLELTYNEELSHLVYGGSDLFLVPSLFEPCGLTQQIAMHYGTVPLVRETGGLVDTVFEEKNGFLFGPPTAEAISETVDRAFEVWHEKPKLWQTLIENGMKENFSWVKPAEEYLKIYTHSNG